MQASCFEINGSVATLFLMTLLLFIFSQDTSGGDIYYFNFTSGESTWDHPCDEFYRKMVQEERDKAKMGGGAGGGGGSGKKEGKKKKDKKEKEKKDGGKKNQGPSSVRYSYFGVTSI